MIDALGVKVLIKRIGHIVNKIKIEESVEKELNLLFDEYNHKIFSDTLPSYKIEVVKGRRKSKIDRQKKIIQIAINTNDNGIEMRLFEVMMKIKYQNPED